MSLSEKQQKEVRDIVREKVKDATTGYANYDMQRLIERIAEKKIDRNEKIADMKTDYNRQIGIQRREITELTERVEKIESREKTFYGMMIAGAVGIGINMIVNK
jgi:phage host-nuclease inhibitor protein Gam